MQTFAEDICNARIASSPNDRQLGSLVKNQSTVRLKLYEATSNAWSNTNPYQRQATIASLSSSEEVPTSKQHVIVWRMTHAGDLAVDHALLR